MFKRKENRFMTRGIDSEVPKEIQIICWELIDTLVKEKSVEVDYLQIFEFEKRAEEAKLVVTHKQEEPTYQKSCELTLRGNLVDFDISKLWVIDDGVNQTMLLPEDY